ncbi:hypothetical protein GPECTOR_129g555 [Gonium pectorale]|uniref:Uncharacterized protein n=1 Tax=Gonium pectorale TaxID=33097 RepID=A0A150FZH7_GONPE|nr:hypothetical protein GPECTOR_129g555 [Gonium pectorale]|eukprot:KXZ42625.1 hypothetical protein GPECTOR_129g555 [Gonium pectorale]
MANNLVAPLPLEDGQVLVELEDAIKRTVWDNRDSMLPKDKREYLEAFLMEHESVKHALEVEEEKSNAADGVWNSVKRHIKIHLGDFFDQLAGTSTGGLLALYFASEGGKERYTVPKDFLPALEGAPDGKPSAAEHHLWDGAGSQEPRGSATGAVALYLSQADTIFPGQLLPFANVVRAGINSDHAMHGKEGLERVLKGAFGEPQDVSALKLSDAKHDVAVSAVDLSSGRSAFFYRSKALGNKAPSPQPHGGTAAAAHWGLALNLRRSVNNAAANKGKVLVRRAPGGLETAAAGGGPAPSKGLGLGRLEEVDQGDEAVQAASWIAPVELHHMDFPMFMVARATSAAPGFLPYIAIKCGDEDKERTFVDGGLANNNPTWVGLTAMLAKYEDNALETTAILSLGTGTAWAGEDQMDLDLRKMVILAMNANGEDKENILDMLYNGILRRPAGQLLRVQLSADARRPEFDLELDTDEVAALSTMDDSKQDLLKRYIKLGKLLAERNRDRLRWWVECFIFGLKDPATAHMPPLRVNSEAVKAASRPMVEVTMAEGPAGH